MAGPALGAPVNPSSRWKAHLAIARIDHWTKNVFILPGIIIPVSLDHSLFNEALIGRIVLGVLATSFVTSSNYVINEVLDAPFDRLHPSKKNRPAASGLVNIPLAYVQWLFLVALGLGLALLLGSPGLTLTLAALWAMGCVYNIPPVRSKDVPYIDVLSESVNNPLRMLAGWYIVTSALFPPLSLLVSYWMVGAYLMGLKRFSEFRQISNQERAGAYRKSFQKYTERSLLVSVMFYASAAMFLFGAFIARYRIELLLSFPLLALVMAVYYDLSFDENSAAQNPESLHRHRGLMAATIGCVVLMTALMFIDIPVLQKVFAPTMPQHGLVKTK